MRSTPEGRSRRSLRIVGASLDVFERYADQAPRVTDATSVALVARHGIDGVLSFDADFDGVVERFDPADS